MHERPSKTELDIRDYEANHKQFQCEITLKDVQMSDVYPSPPASPPQGYLPSSPNYGAPKSPSYVPYKGKPAYSSIPTSPLYISPYPLSPAYTKAPATQSNYTADAQIFQDMLAEHETGTSKASAPLKLVPTVSDTSKEDARWSLMKDEEGMPLKDLATGLEYYTNDLCDQEQTIQETEIGLEHRVKEMNDAASTLLYEDFCKKYDVVERFQDKLRAQLCDYQGAAKLLQANLIIRNEIRPSKLVWQAEEAIAEASKLMDGLLKSANEADEFMNIAHDVAEAKLYREEDLEAAASSLSLSEANDNVTDGSSHYARATQADKDRFDDMLLGLAGDDSEDEEDPPSLAETSTSFGLVDTVSPSSADSSLLQTDLDFDTHGFAGFNAGLKPVAHKPKVSSPLALQPVLTMADEVTPVFVTPELSKFDFSPVGRVIKAIKGADAHASKVFAAGGFSKSSKNLPEFELLPTTRKRSHLGGDDTPVKKAKLGHDFFVPEVHDAPEPLNIDFLSGDRPSGMMNFAAGGLLSVDFLEADDEFMSVEPEEETEEVPEAPVLEPLTANRKRTRSDDDAVSTKKAKFSHDFAAVPDVQIAPEPVTIDFLSGDRPSDMVNFAAGGPLTADFLEADETPVLEPLAANRKRSRSDGCFTPSKKLKLSHDFSAPEAELSNIAPEAAPEIQLSNDISQSNDTPQVNFDFSPAARHIKAMKGSRTGGLKVKVFHAGVFADALKDRSVVEALSSSRKRSYSDDDASRKRPSPSSGDAPLKKTKLSVSTTELVQTLLFDLDSYTTDGQLSLPSNTTTESSVMRKSGKHAAKVGIWRNAISTASSGVKLDTVMGKVGGKKNGLGGLREKYLSTRGGGKVGGLKGIERKVARV